MNYLRIINSFLLALSILATIPAYAGEPATIKVGIYLTDLYDINFAQKNYTAHFWAWFLHSQKTFNVHSSLEAPNARYLKALNTVHGSRGSVIWDQAKFEAVINKEWDMTNYPFDRQTIAIALELTDADTSQTRFVADSTGSKVSQELAIAGWRIEKSRISSEPHTYNTAYGDPCLNPTGPSIYSRVTFEVEMKRHGWRLFFNDFIGFIFAIVLSSYVITINASRRLFDHYPLIVKLNLATGSLFAAVGASYVMQGRLPATTNFTLADAIQLTAFVATFLAVISSMILQWLMNASEKPGVTNRPAIALRFSRGVMVIFIILVLFDVALLIKAIIS